MEKNRDIAFEYMYSSESVCLLLIVFIKDVDSRRKYGLVRNSVQFCIRQPPILHYKRTGRDSFTAQSPELKNLFLLS